MTMSNLSLALRALFWTALLPGFIAGFVPWFYFGVRDVRIAWGHPLHLAGMALVLAGVALLGACVWEFARRGRGTLSPADPPKELVIHGLYRYVRNPMYLAVSTILFGEIALTRSVALFAYWVIWFACANLFVRGVEEPRLRAQFGESYVRYGRAVPRWLPGGWLWRDAGGRHDS
jgi:protein-S-isoprenylcysteine O-methyltransferase Ste14